MELLIYIAAAFIGALTLMGFVKLLTGLQDGFDGLSPAADAFVGRMAGGCGCLLMAGIVISIGVAVYRDHQNAPPPLSQKELLMAGRAPWTCDVGNGADWFLTLKFRDDGTFFANDPHTEWSGTLVTTARTGRTVTEQGTFKKSEDTFVRGNWKLTEDGDSTMLHLSQRRRTRGGSGLVFVDRANGDLGIWGSWSETEDLDDESVELIEVTKSRVEFERVDGRRVVFGR